MCKNMKAKGKLSEEREREKTTEQEIQQEGKLGKSLKLNPKEEDRKANKRASVRRVHSSWDKPSGTWIENWRAEEAGDCRMG